MVNTNNLVERFIQHPSYLSKGAGYLAKTLNVTVEEIHEAKEKARDSIHLNEVTKLQNTISTQEDKIAQLISSTESTDTNGIHSSTKMYSSTRILTQPEIKELSGVDGITSRLGQIWNKLQNNGTWTYSIQVVYTIDDFYTREELKIKLKEVFPNELEAYKLPTVKFFDKGSAAFLYIADDHVGLKYSDSLFDSEYSGEIYEQRMQQILVTILNMSLTLEHLYIVRLGDEADGYNAKTTRYDHDLESQSNKEQFDIYTRVNKRFYDTLFSSGKAKNYSVVNCNNSNHTGKGFSYMLNTAIEFYLEAKYPDVEFRNVSKFIDFIEWGNHVVVVTHGKDEKYMKRPLPLNLTPETDTYLFDLYDKKGYSPNRNWIRLMKGDLHRYNVNEGKSGKYINVPSIAGGSSWIEHNFGNTKPGVLIEYMNKDESSVMSVPIMF